MKFFSVFRLLLVGLSLAYSAGDHLLTCVFVPPTLKTEARSRWLRRTSRRLLPLLRIEVELRGTPPAEDRGGLLLSNHLSYVDIPLLASVAPCLFVAKREVAAWPVFGWFARQSGTLFVHRESRVKTARTVDEIGEQLQQGRLVVIFPEGTSSGGEGVLPFRSPLLQPAFDGKPPLIVAAIRYRLPEGEGYPVEEVAYWKEMTLFPHLLNLLGKSRVRAIVSFASVPPAGEDEDRKALAQRLHAEVARLHAASR